MVATIAFWVVFVPTVSFLGALSVMWIIVRGRS